MQAVPGRKRTIRGLIPSDRTIFRVPSRLGATKVAPQLRPEQTGKSSSGWFNVGVRFMRRHQALLTANAKGQAGSAEPSTYLTHLDTRASPRAKRWSRL